MWRRQIKQWGNSLGIRIPNQVFQKTAFKEGDVVEVHIEDEHTLILKKADMSSAEE